MSATPQANLSFLPWVRQGLAASIATVDTIPPPKTPTLPVAASVAVSLSVNNQPLSATPPVVHLRGPADVVGIDAHQIVRTEPRPGSTDFESNLFPSIEFDRADFPWLFTPAKANANSQLRPWLCLVVVRKQDGVTLTSSPTAPLTMLQIVAPASPAAELPDLAECWAWAHAQVAALGNGAAQVEQALDGAPELSLSRLICPRILAPATDYIACVVPTFELGRKAGLGLDATTADLKVLASAWTHTATSVQLPIYYSWEFRTGADGNFETLARALKSTVPDGLGGRPIDIANPGFAWTPATANPPVTPPPTPTVNVEGALRPLSTSVPSALWTDSNAQPFETKLAPIINQVTVSAATGGSDPLLAPPLYGRWYRGKTTVTPNTATWLDELNLDPRWRVAAAVGTRVIQQQQEALMASAWEQAAEIQNVNQRVRQLQMSMAVGESLHARHLTAIANTPPTMVDNPLNGEEMLLRFAAPAFSRIRMPVAAALVSGQHSASVTSLGPTITAQMAISTLPAPATSSAMRRIGRQRGPLTRRMAAQNFSRASRPTWVACMNYSMGTTPPLPPLPNYARLTSLPTPADVAASVWNYGFKIAAEGLPIIPLPAVDLLPANWDYPGYFRSAAHDHLARIRPAPSGNNSHGATETSLTTGGQVLLQMKPRTALANLARAVVSTSPAALAPTAGGVTPIGVETVMTAPTFPQPMYEPLKELSQNLLLPGLDAVKPNTVLGLQTNRAFMQAYMVGLNVEMGRELLWRGFPTDQRGTYFKNFWGYDAAQAGADGMQVPDADDIDDLISWGDRPLGYAPASTPGDEFVLLLRSDLLRRYPNALIYIAPAVNGGPDNADGSHVMPIFNGSLNPDVAFFGFPVSPQVAIGNGTTTGYFVIIQEHPTEPRFGLDPAVSIAPATHLVVNPKPAAVAAGNFAWGSNAAAMAAITLRQPVRIAIRVSRLVAPATATSLPPPPASRIKQV